MHARSRSLRLAGRSRRPRAMPSSSLAKGADDRSAMMGRTLLAAVVAACASLGVSAVAPARASHDALPPPPYARFMGRSFEPSAAAFDPATGRVLVLSDKDSALYRYEISAAGLALPAGERHDLLRLPDGMQAAKFEGMTRLPSGAFLAVTAFDRPDPSYRRLLRFSYAPDAPVDAAPVAVDDEALSGAIRAASGLPWFKIEGIAVDRTGTKVFFGVRNIGESYHTPIDVAFVVRCPLAGDRVGLPETVIRLSTAEALGGRAEGLSDLQLDVDGDSFLVLTSHEGIENDLDAHSGHLFRVPAGLLLGDSTRPIPVDAPLRGFRAKPEGLAVKPSGALIVVFDDDRDWKHLFAGYEQSDGLFTMIDPRP
jgi:hypothetical protein